MQKSAPRRVVVIGAESTVGRELCSALTAAGEIVVSVAANRFENRADASEAIDEAIRSNGDATAFVIAVFPTTAWRARSLDSFTPVEWREAADAPVRTVLWCLSAIRRHLLPGVTRVVVLAPTVGMFGAATYVAPSAAGEAIRALVKSTARQWGDRGVVLNTVGVPLEVGQGVVGTTLPALGSVDIGGAVRMLCSPDAGAVTGQTLVVDGGAWMP